MRVLHMNKVLVMDTSVFCCYLQVPGKETCGNGSDFWDHERAEAIFKEKTNQGYYVVLPLATIIETGNHIAQASGHFKYEVAKNFSSILRKTAQRKTPWAAFLEPEVLWDDKGLIQLAERFPEDAKHNLSIGDSTIREVANYHAKTGAAVEILTADDQLKSFEPQPPPSIPRRRK